MVGVGAEDLHSLLLDMLLAHSSILPHVAAGVEPVTLASLVGKVEVSFT